MTKNMYIQPSVKITEMVMVQTLCASGGGGTPLNNLNPNATTDLQL
ncbi:MAG: hypothetical protein J5884_03660 [Paludibacteraceae bacterium]|nr:hypothetical protein [Paludibacteraceae bacterium]